MSTKLQRINKIKNFLRMQTSPMSVSEIHEALTQRMHFEISRKTIERDLIDMVENQGASVISGIPSRYTFNVPTEVEILLKIEEVELILQLLDSESELHRKLKKQVLA